MRHSSDMHCLMRKASYRWPLPCRVPGIAPRSLRTGNSASTLTAGGTDARLVSTGCRPSPVLPRRWAEAFT